MDYISYSNPTFMLDIIDDPPYKKINSYKLYKSLGLSSGKYWRWIRDTIIQFGENEVDYWYEKTDRTKSGRPRNHYLLDLEFAKTLCFCAKTKKAISVRRWIINEQIKSNFGQ
jgi:phage anti-repressor protein